MKPSWTGKPSVLKSVDRLMHVDGSDEGLMVQYPQLDDGIMNYFEFQLNV